MAKRTGQERLDAIPAALERAEEFKRRIAEAAGDVVRLSDLMAEAIWMLREANGLEVVGRDGREVVGIEKVTATHCMLDAREAYLKARGSNSNPSNTTGDSNG
jgi:hypothetical protein